MKKDRQRIFCLLDKRDIRNWKTSYWLMINDNEPKKIPHYEWFKLYDSHEVEVMPPLVVCS